MLHIHNDVHGVESTTHPRRAKMLWSQAIEILVIQVIVLLILGLLWHVMPEGMKDSISKYWKIVSPFIWIFTFLFVFTVDDFISAAIIAFTTCALAKLRLRFRVWRQEKKDRSAEQTPTIRFRSVKSFYANK
jgi:Sec-independent protein secretion pathway component TatC